MEPPTGSNDPSNSLHDTEGSSLEASPASPDSSTNVTTGLNKGENASPGTQKLRLTMRMRLHWLWDSIHEAWKALVRALSFSLVVHAFRGLRYPRGRGLHEPTKIAIRHSRTIALLRALVHLVPFGFALFEIILNWNVYYVGSKDYSTAAYQVVAKAHEILVQASIAAIIFSAVRRELALGKGIPFGLLFSGLQVSQISYLWSVELWGAVRAEFPRPLRKAALVTLVAGGIILAVASGPASAVLLIPRLQLWPAGHTHIWINATADQLWPARIDGSTISQECLTIGANTSNAFPASEWYVVRDMLSASWQTTSDSYIARFHTHLAPEPGRIHGLGAVRNLYWGEWLDHFRPGPMISITTTPQAVVADAITEVGSLWHISLVNVTADAGHGSPLSDQSNAKHNIGSNYSQPYSLASCLPDNIENTTDSRHIAFPALDTNEGPYVTTINRTYNASINPWAGPTANVIVHPHYTYAQLLDVSGSAEDYRLDWIDLPGDLFNGSSIGVVILPPRNGTEFVQKVFLCNLAAGWSLSSLAVETGSMGVGAVESTCHYQGFQGTPVPISRGLQPEAEDLTSIFGGALQKPGVSQVINISASWAQYLNPYVEDFKKPLLSVLEEATGEYASAYMSTRILNLLAVNGLSRTGWGSKLQGQVRSIGVNGEGGLDGNHWLKDEGDVFDVDPTESQDWVTLRVDSTLEGYAYNTLTIPPRLAIAVLVAYCLLVVGHVLYSGITGISSNCWDTIAEVTALAVNSTPTAALRNTCAGITELHIFKLPVRILMSKDEEGEGEHLELVFGKVDEEKTKGKTIQANRTYGTLPKGVKGEGKKDV